jgi:hypothetical protein
MGDQPLPTGRAAHSHEVTNTIMNRRNLTTLLTTALLAALPAASAHASSDGTARGLTAALPDGRSYELASPPEKNGADVVINAARTRAAAGETAQQPMAVSFASLAGFADVRGTAVSTEYMAERQHQPGTSGWVTHAITPPQAPMSLLGDGQLQEPLYDGEFSGNLMNGAFRAWSPLAPAPAVADVENLYVRHDLRSPGSGSYSLLSNALSTLPPSLGKPMFVGASEDFSHVLFQSPYSLTADAGGCVPDFNGLGCSPKLYESVNGVTRLSGILPDSTPASTGCLAALPCSIAGQGAQTGILSFNYTPHAISDDGSRVLFSSPTRVDGRPTAPTATGVAAGKIYVRDDHGTPSTLDDTTVQINSSERAVPDTDRTALLETANRTLSRVFFTSTEALTENTTPGTGAHAYMWDASGAPGHHLTLLDVDENPSDPPGPAVAILGASDDGHYVYFVAQGQLVPNAPELDGAPGIYAWHDDGGVSKLDYVGELFAASNDVLIDAARNWGFNPKQSRVSPDGKHLLFASRSGVGLTGYDQAACGGAGCIELYFYSLTSHELACVSCNPAAPASVDATDMARSQGSGPMTTAHLSHAMSDDGTRVFFSTREALLSDDTNGKVDAYEFDVPDGTDVAHGSLQLISTGKDTSDSFFLDASADGHDVFFATRQQLSGWDTDDNYDLYDARVGGGILDPVSVASPCSGDACQGPPHSAAASALGLTASSTFVGSGNVPSVVKAKPKRKPVRCHHGFVRKRVKGKVRCVRRSKSRRVVRVDHRRAK